MVNYCDMLLRKILFSKKLILEEVEKKFRDVVCKRFLFSLGVINVCWVFRFWLSFGINVINKIKLF